MDVVILVLIYLFEVLFLMFTGIGNVQEQLLRSIGVKTCNDLYELRAEIKLLFSQLSFEHYLQIAQVFYLQKIYSLSKLCQLVI